MEPKAGRRIVGRRTYARRQGKRVVMALSGTGLCLLGYFCTLITAGLLVKIMWGVYAYFSLHDNFTIWAVILHPILFVISFCGIFFFWATGTNMVKAADKMNVGILLTRATAADIPAPDFLVRDSTEPPQAGQERTGRR